MSRKDSREMAFDAGAEDSYQDSVFDMMRRYPEDHHFWTVKRGSIQRGNYEQYNPFERLARESPARRIARIYGDEGKNPDVFEKSRLPSMMVDERASIPVYTYDLGLARKNFIEFLPYLRRRIATSGAGDLGHLEDTDVFKNLNYGENWHSAFKYRPFESHPTITGLVSDIKNYDVARGRNRREDMDEWGRLFRKYGYDRIARDIEGHTAEPTLQPLVNMRTGEDTSDGKGRVVVNLADGSGMYKITQHTKERAKKLGVDVKPTQLGKKKIDVFRGGRKVASVGHKDYCDFPTYRECCGTKMANARREAYKTRHDKTRHKEGTPSFYADKLLW